VSKTSGKIIDDTFISDKKVENNKGYDGYEKAEALMGGP
jgi:hypothetical protein